MPLGGSCGSPETSFVFGECAVSVVPSAAICIDDESVVPGECGPSLVPGTAPSMVLFERPVSTILEVGFVALNPLPPPAPEFVERERLTSKPYAVESIDAFNLTAALLKSNFQDSIGLVEFFNMGASMQAVILKQQLIRYQEWPPEFFNMGASMQAVILKQQLIRYQEWPPEFFNMAASMRDGVLKQQLIRYQEWPPEFFNMAASMRPCALE